MSRGHGATLTLDSSGRPQPDAFTNSEAFLAGVSSCGVTLIEMHAQETGVPLTRMAVTIEGSRDPAVPRYQSVHMRFEIAGVSQAQAEDLRLGTASSRSAAHAVASERTAGRARLGGRLGRASRWTSGHQGVVAPPLRR